MLLKTEFELLWETKIIYNLKYLTLSEKQDRVVMQKNSTRTESRDMPISTLRILDIWNENFGKQMITLSYWG